MLPESVSCPKSCLNVFVPCFYTQTFALGLLMPVEGENNFWSEQ